MAVEFITDVGEPIFDVGTEFPAFYFTGTCLVKADPTASGRFKLPMFGVDVEWFRNLSTWVEIVTRLVPWGHIRLVLSPGGSKVGVLVTGETERLEGLAHAD